MVILAWPLVLSTQTGFSEERQRHQIDGWSVCLLILHINCNLPTGFDDVCEDSLQEAAWPLPKGDREPL